MSWETINLEFKPVAKNREDTIAVLSLNRPKSANALSGEMIEEAVAALKEIGERRDCRLTLIRSEGKHFSAGADLNWMKNAAKLNFQENVEDAAKLMQLFEALYHLPQPTIAVTKGAAYGGAVGLIACCDITIATDDSRYCLSEVRLGILPAVIMPYLARRMLAGQLRRLSLSAREFKAVEAKEAGLIDLVVNKENLEEVLRDEVNHLLCAGPEAQKTLKSLHQTLVDHSLRQDNQTLEAIAAARTGKEGQTGLHSFFAKKKTPWFISLTDEWTFDESH